MIKEQALKNKNIVYLCYVDFSEAFDKVKHEENMEILAEIEIDGNDKKKYHESLLEPIWFQQFGDEQSEWIEIKQEGM